MNRGRGWTVRLMVNRAKANRDRGVAFNRIYTYRIDNRERRDLGV